MNEWISTMWELGKGLGLAVAFLIALGVVLSAINKFIERRER